MTIKISKPKNGLDDLLSRQDYLVTQGNDLAKSFGNLSAFEHKVLDYCFSMVKKSDNINQQYYLDALDIIRHLGLNASGQNYNRVAKAFKALNEKTAMYVPIIKNGVRGISMFQLFDEIEYMEDGKTMFSFSRKAAPYVFDLVDNFYSFKLSELSKVTSKYGLILLKIWESKRMGKSTSTVISGSLDEWQDWFLGENKKSNEAAGKFKQRCLLRGMENLDKVYPNVDFDLETIYDHRKTIGFKLTITGTPHGKGSKL